MMGNFLQDVRFGVRILFNRPGVTLVAVIALALGIGANTAIFSVVNALLVRPLPFDDLDRIVKLWEEAPAYGVVRNEVSAANFLDWRSKNQTFEHLGAYAWWNANLSAEMPERVQGFLLTSDLFAAVGAKPALGRLFTAEEEQPGHDRVLVISHGLWQRLYGADPEIIGKEVVVNGIARTIIGVMGADFNFPVGGEVWGPLAFTPQQAQTRRSYYLLVVGRLRPGVTLDEASADINTIAAQLEQQYPETNTGRRVSVNLLLEDTVRDYKTTLMVLLVAVGFVLLIACANVANLLLARASGRQKEMAIRSALGASRSRIVGQLLTESVMLALVGGVAGLLLAVWGVDLLKTYLPPDFIRFVPGWDDIGIDARVLGFTFAISLLTGIIFGLAPALHASKPDLSDSLKEGGGKSSAGPRRSRLRSLLVLSEIALSLMLVISAALLIKSLSRLMEVDPGFRTDNILTVNMTLPVARYSDSEKVINFHDELLERVESLPGVESAATIIHIPLGGSNSTISILAEGRPEPPPGQRLDINYRSASPRYFETMGIPILQGRGFTPQDTAASRQVAIVNYHLARLLWGDESPLGKRVRRAGPASRNRWLEVVGVSGDVRDKLDGPVKPEIYFPHAQAPENSTVLVVRTKSDPLSLADAVRGEVRAIDKDQPVFMVMSMEQARSKGVMFQRFSATALGIFAAVALVLAAVGIYGVMSYTVTQRTHELGIRMALGARPVDVLRIVLRQTIKLTLSGVAVGLVAAYAVTRFMSSMLFGVSPTDTVIFVGISLLSIAVALFASYLPARKATKLDPIIALRCE